MDPPLEPPAVEPPAVEPLLAPEPLDGADGCACEVVVGAVALCAGEVVVGAAAGGADAVAWWWTRLCGRGRGGSFSATSVPDKLRASAGSGAGWLSAARSLEDDAAGAARAGVLPPASREIRKPAPNAMAAHATAIPATCRTGQA